MFNHIKKWNEWRKGNCNSWFWKLLVLVRLRRSPTFESFLTKRDYEDIAKAVDEGIRNANPILMKAWSDLSEKVRNEFNDTNQSHPECGQPDGEDHADA